MTATTWKIDPAHTDVQFSAKHMMVTTVRGKFHEVDGTVTIDDANPAATSGSFTVKAASLNTGFEQRDVHLRSGDFFDAENHPEITFTVTGVAPKGGSDYSVTGDLTIREITKPVSFAVEFLGNYQGFQGRRAGFRGTTKLNREDWGLTWNMALETGGWLVGKEIKLEIDVALDEVLEAAAVEAETAGASA
ncbi:MAG TPA: YceI family protein [Candidatus Limnocylindrales bacterium]|nr:YceI family protein [Candidatus Limnocylindrales bacterium]